MSTCALDSDMVSFQPTLGFWSAGRPSTGRNTAVGVEMDFFIIFKGFFFFNLIALSHQNLLALKGVSRYRALE